jgi:hypothetical protein
MSIYSDHVTAQSVAINDDALLPHASANESVHRITATADRTGIGCAKRCLTMIRVNHFR